MTGPASEPRAYIVEPQTVFQPYLRTLLERAGFAVVEASRDVDQKAIDTARPGVVFVDVDFFQRGGATALCRIREALGAVDTAAQQTPVVAYTIASDDPTHRAACYISGATLVCSKDATETELLTLLRGVARPASGSDDAPRRPKSGFGA